MNELLLDPEEEKVVRAARREVEATVTRLQGMGADDRLIAIVTAAVRTLEDAERHASDSAYLARWHAEGRM